MMIRRKFIVLSTFRIGADGRGDRPINGDGGKPLVLPLFTVQYVAPDAIKQMISRRQFIQTTGLTLSASALSAGRVLGANSQVRMAVIGLGWWGGHLIDKFTQCDPVRIVALCDVDRQHLNRAADQLEKQRGAVDRESDYRRLLDRKDIDVVVLAVPNHWHALMTIEACQAGKDVYVEKPCAHSIWEGQQMVKAARRYNRIVQVGLQGSSTECLPELVAWLREGHIGSIQAIHAIWYNLNKRAPIGKRTTPLKPPASLDYHLWLGPAQDLPLYRDQFHYDWHWNWNTGNGEIGNIGTHAIDLARHFLGDPEPTGEVISFGNRFQWGDAGETPNMHVAAYEMAGVPVILEMNNFPDAPGRKAGPVFRGTRRGQIVVCEGGTFVGHGKGKVVDLQGKVIRKFSSGHNHHRNFIDAVISRNRRDLNAEIERGNDSCQLPLLANIAHRTGEPVSPKKLEDHISDAPYLHDAFTRYQAQAMRLGFDFNKQPWILGQGLSFDAGVGRFAGKGETVDRANMLLRRETCRPPFVVPEEV
jgi:predicted dehydrogenase